MSNLLSNSLENIKKRTSDTQKNSSFNVGKFKEMATDTADNLNAVASVLMDQANITKDEITEKLTELDRMLETAVTEYNESYTLMNDKGIRLYVERSRAVDTITAVEDIINSIANHPKSFDQDFDEIKSNRDKFIEVCEFAEKELQVAREAAGGAGAGLAAGAAVAFMAPTAAMWVATTFGTASTGAAISTLSGAAATNAALAWLGGGALGTSATAGGMAAGNALLAMAGPIGWTIAGATLLSSIIIFTSKKNKLNKQKNEEIETVKQNTERVKEADLKIKALLDETTSLREGVNKNIKEVMLLYGAEYSALSDEDKYKLGALVNNTKALSAYFEKTIE